MRAKLEAGAHVVMTQPIYDPISWTRFLEAYGVERLPVPVLAGIHPLQSSKHAEFLHNEVPGITLSDEARERMAAPRPLWAAFWLAMLLPGNGGWRRNPRGTTEGQARHFLALVDELEPRP